MTMLNSSGTDDLPPEVLWEDGERIFCRIWRVGADGRWQDYMAVRYAAEYPTPDAIVRLFLNLIRNASQAMSTLHDGPRQLIVRTSMATDGVLVTVQDSGPGIDPANLNRLFDAFYTTSSRD